MSDRRWGRRRMQLLGCMALAAAVWCWLEYRAAGSRRSSHGSLVRQVEAMHSDAAHIRALRSARQLATDRERPNDLLLSLIRDSLSEAGVSIEQWAANDPVPPVRIPQTPYKRLGVRLAIQEIDLRRLVHFAMALSARDSSLVLDSLRLAAVGPRHDRWNADLTITYLIYAPSTGTP